MLEKLNKTVHLDYTQVTLKNVYIFFYMLSFAIRIPVLELTIIWKKSTLSIGVQFSNIDGVLCILVLSNVKEEMKLADIKSVFSDNEYTIMSEIMENNNITQRQLSKKLGVSVSTVNALINKMIKEGLIKMSQVSKNQVFYMLTPVGMMEKAKKTVRYLKVHYRAIYETKEKIKAVLDELDKEHDVIFVLINDDEMGEMIGIAVEECQYNHIKSKIKIINKTEKLDMNGFSSPILLHTTEDEYMLRDYVHIVGLKVFNLTEKL